MNSGTGTDTNVAGNADYIGAKMGMWLFLFTEMLFFGGMFLLYAVYRADHTADFQSTSAELDRMIGAFNTLVLITSSLTAALSLSMIRKGSRKYSQLCLGMTILLGALFLIVKYFEWSEKITHGVYPGSSYLEGLTHGKILFYSLYFVMTGIHAAHILIGLFVFAVMMIMIHKGSVHKGDFIKLENSALYWHFVDMVWIYLFPLLYLLR